MTKEKHKEIGARRPTPSSTARRATSASPASPSASSDRLPGRVDKVYGLKFGKFVSSQQQYDTLDNGSADVLFGFTTDGELTTGKYVLLEDDKSLWPPYQVSFLIRDDALEKIGPEGQKVIEDVQKPLTEKVMGELNSRVVLDKQEPEKVAADYLREAGFTK